MPRILGGDIRCPIARSLDVLGDRWTLMIVRDAMAGKTRFSEFRESLGIPRDVLTARLETLVDGGALERRSYRADGSRAREEYVLTTAGRELIVVLGALGQWADRNRPAPERSLISFVDDAGDPVGVRLATAGGRVLTPDEVVVRVG